MLDERNLTVRDEDLEEKFIRKSCKYAKKLQPVFDKKRFDTSGEKRIDMCQ